MKHVSELLPSSPEDFFKAVQESEEELKNPLRQEKTQGYWAEPNTTAVWNYFFDFLMVGMDENMLKVTLYLIRHTFGYNKGDGDYIIEDQFIKGTVTKKGERVDWGCGIKTSTMTEESIRMALRRAIRKLEKVRIVYVRRGVKRKPDDKFPTNFYRLYLKEKDLKSVHV